MGKTTKRLDVEQIESMELYNTDNLLANEYKAQIDEWERRQRVWDAEKKEMTNILECLRSAYTNIIYSAKAQSSGLIFLYKRIFQLQEDLNRYYRDLDLSGGSATDMLLDLIAIAKEELEKAKMMVSGTESCGYQSVCDNANPSKYDAYNKKVATTDRQEKIEEAKRRLWEGFRWHTAGLAGRTQDELKTQFDSENKEINWSKYLSSRYSWNDNDKE